MDVVAFGLIHQASLIGYLYPGLSFIVEPMLES